MSGAGEFGMWLAIGAANVGLFSVLYPLARAWARRIEGRLPPSVEARLEALEERGLDSGEVHLTRQRLADLEERLDFAERLLAQPRDAEPAARPLEPGRAG